MRADQNIVNRLVSLAYKHQSTANIYDSFDRIDEYKNGSLTEKQVISYIVSGERL